MTVAIDGNAIGFAVPCADRGFEIVDQIIGINLLGNPSGHLIEQTLASRVALEWGAHLDDIKIDRTGRDRLLQAWVVVGLRQVDPVDFSARIGFPWLQETAEQKIVQVLVVKAHERQFDSGKFSFLNALFRRPETHFTNLLPVGICW